MNLIGNGILALLRNPSELAALREDPSRIPNAVEEFLRFDGPVNIATARFTTAPVRIGDVDVPANQFVMISLLAANREGSRFENPDRLDAGRKTNGHLAFGHGIHYCVGAPLARLVGEIAFRSLLARFDCMTLDSTATLVYRNSTLMHGLKALPIRLGHMANPSPDTRSQRSCGSGRSATSGSARVTSRVLGAREPA